MLDGRRALIALLVGVALGAMGFGIAIAQDAASSEDSPPDEEGELPVRRRAQLGLGVVVGQARGVHREARRGPRAHRLIPDHLQRCVAERLRRHTARAAQPSGLTRRQGVGCGGQAAARQLRPR